MKKFSDYMQQNCTKMFFKDIQGEYSFAWFAASKPIELFNFAAYKTKDGESTKISYENTVFFKTLANESNRILDGFVNYTVDDNIKRIYKEYKSLKQHSIFKGDDYDEKLRILLRCEDLYDSLLSKCVGLNYVLKSHISDFQSIKNQLNDGEYAVEFCNIPVYEKLPNEVDYYGAYVFNNKSKYPTIVSLCKKEDFDNKFFNSNADQLFYNETYKSSNQIYKLLLKKIEALMPGAKTIYYSPSGGIVFLNLDCLRDDGGRLLNEKYKLVRVSSTANIGSVKHNNDKYTTAAVLYGDINYNLNSEGLIFV